MYLLGYLVVVAATVSDGRVDDRAFDDDEDKHRDPEDEEEEIALIASYGASVPKGRLRVLRGAGRDDEGCGERWHQECKLKKFGGNKPVMHLDAVLSCWFDGLDAALAVPYAAL